MIYLRILAIDFGSKRVGLAISDPIGLFAQPLGLLHFKNKSKFITDLKKIIGEKDVQMVLVGLPRRMNDDLGPEAEKCIRISENIRKECGIEVQMWDERFTTKEAEDILINEFDLSREKRKKVIDSMAACLILQSYLASKTPRIP